MRQRNNITRLNADIRSRISILLDDGATYEETRSDPEVKAACEEKGLQLHDSTFQAWLCSDEHKGCVEARRRYGREIERRKLAAYVVSSQKSSDDLARIASFEVLRRVMERLESGEELDARDLRSVAATLSGYERNRIAQAAADARAEADREIRKYQEKIRELEEKLAAVNTEKPAGVLSDEQMDQIRQRLGLR